MKRRLLIVAVFLLAGAVVNVAVSRGLDTWNRVKVVKAMNTKVYISHGLIEPGILPDEDRTPVQLDYAVGWPTDTVEHPFKWDEPGLHSTRLIWSGAAVNTIFYAAVLWLVTCGPFVARRVVRVRRGRCAKCGYPTGRSDVCSECGKPLPERAKVTAT